MGSADNRQGKVVVVALVNECNPGDGESGILAALKAQHEAHSLFDSAVVLVTPIVYICVCPHGEIRWQYAVFLQRCPRCRGSGIPIERDLLGVPLLIDRSRKAALSRGDIAVCTSFQL